MTVTVSQLNIYPIKGCRGMGVASATCLPTGLPYDRHWMVVTEQDGKFITQRQIPKLCQVSVGLPAEAVVGGQLRQGAALTVSAAGMPDLLVPLADTAAPVPEAQLRRVTVWEWTGIAADEGDEAAAWFSQYLGRPVRLVRHLHASGLPDSCRPTDPEFAPGHSVKFADGFPLLVALEESLEDLCTQLGSACLPMNRFRPNIVLAGAGRAWSDDTWSSITITSSNAAPTTADMAVGGVGSSVVGNGVVLQYVKPCDRCKVPTIDQDTAEVGDEPLVALGKIRSGKVLGWSEQRKSWTHAVFFGWNAAVVQQGGISVGDAVTVVHKPGAPQ